MEIIPYNHYLSQNYPNPFNPVTTINYGVAKQGFVKIAIYDVVGRKIKDLINNNHSPGHYQVNWNGTNSWSEKVSSGIYYYQLILDNNTETKKLLLLK